MIDTNLELSEDQRKAWLREVGVLPVDPVGYAWQQIYGTEIPKPLRCRTLAELNATRSRESYRYGGSLSAKRYGRTQA